MSSLNKCISTNKLPNHCDILLRAWPYYCCALQNFKRFDNWNYTYDEWVIWVTFIRSTIRWHSRFNHTSCKHDYDSSFNLMNLWPIECNWKHPQLNLTHWGRVTHLCVGKLTIIGSDNDLSPGRRQAIIWINAGILLVRPLGTKFNEILIGIQTFSFKKMYLKMSSAKWHPFCLSLNVLTHSGLNKGVEMLQMTAGSIVLKKCILIWISHLSFQLISKQWLK